MFCLSVAYNDQNKKETPSGSFPLRKYNFTYKRRYHTRLKVLKI